MRRKHIRNLLLLFVLYKRPFILFFIQKYEKTINVTLFYTKPSIGTKAFNEQLYCKEDILFKKSMAISPIILIAYKVRYLEIINLWLNESIFGCKMFLKVKLAINFCMYVLCLMVSCRKYKIMRLEEQSPGACKRYTFCVNFCINI